ncbi:hypothetical protein L873DRAFT_1786861 [Choiromyces venosus 120613-1]|uniref:Uncharacterized protein n=1 Tax=Choiromyces venosus 120613-1 TaxID=1336337 RepID=A0A3N4JYS4_9PEZI|nr:hypothetical protein L873DRAFT_1786861 [Choiromyces venosus 120613-1]
MATKLDPHHLVALMKYALKGKQDSSPHRLDPSLHTFKGGIVNNHETSVRTFPILDALAHISVSLEESQVVAIGLQLHSWREEIRLTVAENKGVMNGLVNHLTKVWRNLQALSSKYEKHRDGKWDKSQLRSPDMPSDVGHLLKIEIFRDIYQYSLKKQMKRIDKWSEDLGRFVKELLRRREFLQLQGFELSLYNAVVALSMAVEVVSKLRDNPNVQLTRSEWEFVYFQSMQANQDVKIVLADRNGFGCEVLAQEFFSGHPGEDPFPLRRALEKLTSLPHHITSLFGFANSPHLQPALRYRLCISAVPKKAHTVELPASLEDWKSFLEAACGKRYDFQKTHAVELVEMFGSGKWVCPVHCECGLIQYLQARQGNQWDNIPPFSYIGVSKLSCSACRIWMEASNKQSRRKFYTRGSHGKWYWPWGVPGGGGVVNVMAQKVLDEYLAYLMDQKLLRSYSESTDASSDGAQHHLSDDQQNNNRAAAVARMQAHGAPGFGYFDTRYPDA